MRDRAGLPASGDCRCRFSRMPRQRMAAGLMALADAAISTDRMIRQMASVIRHHPVQLFPAMKDVGAMVAMCVELAVANAIRADYPDIGIAARNEHIAIDDVCHVDVGRHRLISLLDDDRRRGRHGRRENDIHFARVDHELALPVGRASCQESRACRRCQQGVCYGFQLQSPVGMVILSNDCWLTVNGLNS